MLAASAAIPLPLLLLAPTREQWLAINSLILAAATCCFALPAGLLLAALLGRTDLRGRRAALFILAALLLMPLYLQTAAWDAGFGRQGWYSVVLGSLAAPPLVGWRGAIWIHAMAAIPWTTLIIAVGLRRIDPEWEEAALLDAGPSVVFWRITLPHACDSIALAALWIVISTLGEFTVTDMYQVNTYARELYFGFALGEVGMIGSGAATASGAPLGVWAGVAITGWLVIAALAFFNRLSRWERPSTLRRPHTFRLGSARLAATLLVILACMLVAGVPLANLAYQAGISVEQWNGERTRNWSATKLALLLVESPGRFSREIGWTLLIGGVTASLAVLLAAPLAWLARRSGVKSLPALGVAAAGVAIPGPIVALLVINALNHEDAPLLVWLYDRTIFAPTFALLVRTLPWAIVICWVAFRSLSAETLESAELDGAGPVAQFLWIGAPQRRPALALAWLVSFVVASGDLAATILVAPPGVETLPIRIFGLIHAGVDDQVAAVCLMVALAVITLAAIAHFLWRRTTPA